MPTSVTMPALGESVTEGTVTRWLKQEGEQVQVDEPLLEVSTDKVDTEIPSPAAGVLTKILVAEDETVEVGAELAVIGGDGDGGGSGGPASAEDTESTPQTPVQQVEDTGPAPQEEPPSAPQEEPAPASADSGSGGGGGGGEGTSVTMPALGESVTEGTVTRWLKAVGDEVTADEPLLEVSTDKVDTEIPSPVSGTLLEITVNEDETVDVGAQLAVIGSGSGGGAAAPAPQQEAPTQEAPTQEAPKQEAPAPQQPAPQEARPASEQPGGDYGSSGGLPTQSPTSAPAPSSAVAPQAPAEETPSGNGGGNYVTPLVRRLAAEHGVDLGTVS